MEIRFKLNPKNEKDQVIIDVLSGEYSPSEAIKNILYKMGRNAVLCRGKEIDGTKINGYIHEDMFSNGQKSTRCNEREGATNMDQYGMLEGGGINTDLKQFFE